MLEAACPNCGAPIRFRSVDLPIRVCDFCRSSILRSHETLQAMGRVAEVPDDVSPLQIGVRGNYEGHAFELVGRVRWRWSDGAWNEWLALFDNGTTAWLGEAMGRFMLLRALDRPFTNKLVKMMDRDEPIPVGAESTIDKVTYTVTDVKDVTCVAAEGELPFATPAGLAMRSVDLMASEGLCASVQKDRGEVAVYTGRYVALADIAATGLRAFEGWPMPTFAA